VAEWNSCLEDAALLCDRRVKNCENIPQYFAIPMQAEAQCLAQEIRDLKEPEVPAQTSVSPDEHEGQSEWWAAREMNNRSPPTYINILYSYAAFGKTKPIY
jgi:hypothetical protein